MDGPASSEGTSLAGEVRQALLAARVRDSCGPAALTPRQALWLGTRGGARCLGRADEIGALRPGLLADIALWRVDTLAHDAIAQGPDGEQGGDPVAALVLGPPAPLELLLVGGTLVVEHGELRTTDVTAAARDVRAARLRLAVRPMTQPGSSATATRTGTAAPAGQVGDSPARPTAGRRSPGSSPTPPTCGWTACCGVPPCGARTPGPGSPASTSPPRWRCQEWPPS